MPKWIQERQDPEEQMRKFRSPDPLFWYLVGATILTIVLSIFFFALTIWPSLIPFV